jgi:hypothetical protein
MRRVTELSVQQSVQDLQRRVLLVKSKSLFFCESSIFIPHKLAILYTLDLNSVSITVSLCKLLN